MHEAAIANSIIRRAMGIVEYQSSALEPASYSSKPIVSKITVKVGEFRNVDPESLNFAFCALRQEHWQLRDATLEIRVIEPLAVCTISEHVYRPAPESFFSCTTCGGGIKKLLTGEELEIASIEIEETSDSNIMETRASDLSGSYP